MIVGTTYVYVQCSVPYFDNTRTAINFISYFRTKYASVKTWKDSEDPRADLGPDVNKE